MQQGIRDSWQQKAIKEVEQELQNSCPVFNRFFVVDFVSSSKGKTRKRQHPKEITLVEDTYKAPGKFTQYENLPFDTLSTEVYKGSQLDGLELEAKLRKEILQL